VTGWPNCSGSRRRCGAWPKRPGCQGDHDTALRHCERGYQASADVTDASYLYPYLLTGVRAHLARGDVDAAQTWSDRVGAVLTVRAIPGTLLRSATPGDCSCSPGARYPRRIRNCRRPASRGRYCGRFWEGT